MHKQTEDTNRPNRQFFIIFTNRTKKSLPEIAEHARLHTNTPERGWAGSGDSLRKV